MDYCIEYVSPLHVLLGIRRVGADGHVQLLPRHTLVQIEHIIRGRLEVTAFTYTGGSMDPGQEEMDKRGVISGTQCG